MWIHGHEIFFLFVSTATGRRYFINYSLNCSSCNVVYLMTCKICGLQYVGSTTTKFRFNNYKLRIRCNGRLEEVNQEDDDLLCKHLWSVGHRGLADVKIQIIG